VTLLLSSSLYLESDETDVSSAPLELVPDETTATSKPTDLLFVDASAERWDAVHINTTSGCLRIYSGEWNAADHRDWFGLLRTPRHPARPLQSHRPFR
jgi:hypothetical protein